MGELAMLAIVGVAIALSGSTRGTSSRTPARRSPSSGSSGSPIPAARITWTGGNRDEWARQTFTEVAASLHDFVPVNLRNLVAAAITAIAARESAWGSKEREHNPFCLHASSGPRARIGQEILKRFANRRAGIRAAVELLEGSRYRSALEQLAEDLDASDRSLEAFKSAAAAYMRRLEVAGYTDLPGTQAQYDEFATIAGGVYSRLTRAGISWGAAQPGPRPGATPSQPVDPDLERSREQLAQAERDAAELQRAAEQDARDAAAER